MAAITLKEGVDQITGFDRCTIRTSAVAHSIRVPSCNKSGAPLGGKVFKRTLVYLRKLLLRVRLKKARLRRMTMHPAGSGFRTCYLVHFNRLNSVPQTNTALTGLREGVMTSSSTPGCGDRVCVEFRWKSLAVGGTFWGVCVELYRHPTHGDQKSIKRENISLMERLLTGQRIAGRTFLG